MPWAQESKGAISQVGNPDIVPKWKQGTIGHLGRESAGALDLGGKDLTLIAHTPRPSFTLSLQEPGSRTTKGPSVRPSPPLLGPFFISSRIHLSKNVVGIGEDVAIFHTPNPLERPHRASKEKLNDV